MGKRIGLNHQAYCLLNYKSLSHSSQHISYSISYLYGLFNRQTKKQTRSYISSISVKNGGEKSEILRISFSPLLDRYRQNIRQSFLFGLPYPIPYIVYLISENIDTKFYMVISYHNMKHSLAFHTII